MTDRVPQTGDPDDPAPAPRRGSRRTGVVALALVGLALAAGVTYLASTLVSQPIGLTSEPATVGDSLAPGAPPVTTTTRTGTTTTSTAPAVTTVTTTVVAPPPVQTVPQPGAPPAGGGDADHDDD